MFEYINTGILLYIDPGTGSMLFTILIGIIGTSIYSIKTLIMKLKQRITGGKSIENSDTIPLVIFSDDKRYWPVFEPICRELNKRERDVVYMTSSEDDPALGNPYPHIKAEFIGKQAKAFARLNFLKATLVLSTTPGLDVYQWKRSKNVNYYVHIPHAAGEITLYKMFGIDYYDAVLLSGDNQLQDIRFLEDLRDLPAKELIKVGIPYMDEMVFRLQHSVPVPPHDTTVLLAPSWGMNSLFNTYGEKIIDKLLETGYHIIIRPHPQSFTSERELIQKLMEQYPDSEQIEWNQDTDNFEVLRRSDIMISDFSGVIFDFALVYDKPVIYTNPHFDSSQYDAWWLNTPIWTFSALPRIGRELTNDNINKLKVLIDSCLTDSHYSEERQIVRNEGWVHFGEGAQRTVDYLLNKYEELIQTEEEK